MLLSLATIRTSALAIAGFILLAIISGLISANTRRVAAEHGWDTFFLRAWNAIPAGWRNVLPDSPPHKLWWLWLCLGLSSGLGIALWLLSPPPPIEIFAPFEKEFHANEAALGKPISRAEPAFINKDNRLGAVQVVTEYAIVLWLDYPGYIFAIPKDSSKHDHVVFAADSVYGAAWTLIPSEVRARKPFQSMPSSCKLPNGGIIEHWYENPEEWGWIGCSEWIVALNAKQMFSQEFEHGLITGPWLVTPDRDAGEIYTIRWTDKKWSSSRSRGLFGLLGRVDEFSIDDVFGIPMLNRA
jgi:hypothetical protein